MISKIIIPTLLLLVKVQMMECLDSYVYNGGQCGFAPINVFNSTLHYTIGDKILLTVWCTSTSDFKGDRHPKFETQRSHYDFYQHKDDDDKDFTLGFYTEKLSEPPNGAIVYNATTTLILDPAFMRYDSDRIISRMPNTDNPDILTWVDLDIVQLKEESYAVTVPNNCPNVTLFCELEYPVTIPSNREPFYVWKKQKWDRSDTLMHGDGYLIGKDGTLVIDPLIPYRHRGFYECFMYYMEDTDEVRAERTTSTVVLTYIDNAFVDESNMSVCHEPPETIVIAEWIPPPPVSHARNENRTEVKPVEITEIEYMDWGIIGLFVLGTLLVVIAVLFRVTKSSVRT